MLQGSYFKPHWPSWLANRRMYLLYNGWLVKYSILQMRILHCGCSLLLTLENNGYFYFHKCQYNSWTFCLENYLLCWKLTDWVPKFILVVDFYMQTLLRWNKSILTNLLLTSFLLLFTLSLICWSLVRKENLRTFLEGEALDFSCRRT